MSGYFFSAAALVAFAAFLTHSLIGSKYAVRPLLSATDITPASRWLNYLCWHMATILVLVMAATLTCVAADLISRDAVIPIAIMAFGTSILSIVITLRAGINPLRFPASYLFGMVAILAVLGLVST